MSKKAVAEMAMRILLSANTQARLVKMKVKRSWAAGEAVRYASEFSELELLDGFDSGLVATFFIDRVSNRIGYGVGASAESMMPLIYKDISKVQSQRETYQSLVDELIGHVDEAIEKPIELPPVEQVIEEVKTPEETVEAPSVLKDIPNIELASISLDESGVDEKIYSRVMDKGLGTVGELLTYLNGGQKLSDLDNVRTDWGDSWEEELRDYLLTIVADDAVAANSFLRG